MSSIRLFILGSLAQHGEMHGHQLRLLAEEEHVHLWTDITVGSVYGAIKRLASEGLIDVVRVEREGNFPERQIYAISASGRDALAGIRLDQLTSVTFKPDPFDLALTRLDGERLDDMPHVIEGRIAALQALLADTEAANDRALPHLTLSESFAMKHRAHRMRGELDWQRELLAAMPDIVADERRHNEQGRAPLPTVTPVHADNPEAGSRPATADRASVPKSAPGLPSPTSSTHTPPETPPRKATTHV
ncbi:PadR family transcriptional regulator [Subtercola boreus]|uniref:Transcription regulator PadR N-terminal domain-containing protein n=1 Tax=Subtercola boreus TaxID=120213 RepID=A0A3E0W7F7_9MICO|nr:PadR family transcriptional regulator [Subtercola boreus]RFA19025.1 hypothetical protein B7R24_12875 [Subtercola boreus]RFA19163.1 hypothetical protein B7R23_12855 [Subtercola boreus]RFA25625.1 hypothetical protein B7R25_12975 [Subtercola boreus]